VPELPEVEVVRAGLERYAVGRTIETAAVLHPRAVRRHAAGPEDFAARLPGHLITGARRRGKYLWLPMTGGGGAGAGHPAADAAASQGPDGSTGATGISHAPGIVGGVAPGAAGTGSAGTGSAGTGAAGTGGAGTGGAGADTGVGAPAAAGAVGRAGPVGAVAAAGTVVTGAVQAVGEAGAAGDAGPAGDALLAHLGMSGQLLIGDPDRPLPSHLRARFTFTDGGPDLRFVDQRTFGHLCLVPGGADLPAPIAHIAPDPLEAAFDPAVFAAALRRRRTGIKRALLDQSLVSGVGNIYADEALWRARLHWARPTETLRRAEVDRVLAAVHEVLSEALIAGGTSFDALYVNVNGQSGYFGRSLAAYGREGAPCPRCGTPIRRDAFMNRSAYSCPRCQPRPRHPRW
jgi:formamidopyrimidine-DNA glycosylase